MKRRKNQEETKPAKLIVMLRETEKELLEKLSVFYGGSLSSVARELLLIGIEETEAEQELNEWEEKQRLKRVAEWVRHRDS